jgi:hypothetical protein
MVTIIGYWCLGGAIVCSLFTSFKQIREQLAIVHPLRYSLVNINVTLMFFVAAYCLK